MSAQDLCANYPHLYRIDLIDGARALMGRSASAGRWWLVRILNRDEVQ